MNNAIRTLSLVYSAALVLMLGACATPISQERLATADYGPPPSENYQEVVKASFAQILIDPTSPIYEFAGPPEKGYVRQSPMLNLPEGFGWKVCGMVNSKNRMGGYSGSVPFFVLMRGDTITHRVLGEIPDPRSGGLSFLNNSIYTGCQRSVINRSGPETARFYFCDCRKSYRTETDPFFMPPCIQAVPCGSGSHLPRR